MKNDDKTDYERQMNVEVKPSRLLLKIHTLPRAMLRLPPVTNIGRADVYCLPGKLSLLLDLSGKP